MQLEFISDWKRTVYKQILISSKLKTRNKDQETELTGIKSIREAKVCIGLWFHRRRRIRRRSRRKRRRRRRRRRKRKRRRRRRRKEKKRK
jgi:hypothetical protein